MFWEMRKVAIRRIAPRYTCTSTLWKKINPLDTYLTWSWQMTFLDILFILNFGNFILLWKLKNVCLSQPWFIEEKKWILLMLITIRHWQRLLGCPSPLNMSHLVHANLFQLFPSSNHTRPSNGLAYFPKEVRWIPLMVTEIWCYLY